MIQLLQEIDGELGRAQIIWDSYIARLKESPLDGLAIASNGYQAAATLYVYGKAKPKSSDAAGRRDYWEATLDFTDRVVDGDVTFDANIFGQFVQIAKKEAARKLGRSIRAHIASLPAAPQVYTAWCVDWEESERGWGTRPDGWTLHQTKEQTERYMQTFMDEQRKSSGESAPDEYTRPNGDPYEVKVGLRLWARITAKDVEAVWDYSLLREKLDYPLPLAQGRVGTFQDLSQF
jgi:hypothetical protein